MLGEGLYSGLLLVKNAYYRFHSSKSIKTHALVDVHDVVGVVDPEDGVAGVPVEVVHGHAPRRPAHQRQQRRHEDRGHDGDTALTSAILRHSGYAPVASQPSPAPVFAKICTCFALDVNIHSGAATVSLSEIWKPE